METANKFNYGGFGDADYDLNKLIAAHPEI
jgi:hypothetical protein